MAVVITKPLNGAKISGTYIVTANFTLKGFDIATVTLDGKQLASDSTLPLSFSINTTKVANGSRPLVVAVRYRTSNGKLRWQKASVTVLVNNVVSPPPSEWVRVASEYQNFTLTTTKEVRYGANNIYNTKILNPGTYTCNNPTFGDPVPGALKYCDARSTTSTPPPPLPPNAVLSNPTAVIA